VEGRWVLRVARCVVVVSPPPQFTPEVDAGRMCGGVCVCLLDEVLSNGRVRHDEPG